MDQDPKQMTTLTSTSKSSNPQSLMDTESSFFGGSDFPNRGVLPKAETGALSFLASNPEYDGRGTIVAILDTGCDPGSEGLSITTDGKPKFIDVVDATGSGDVNTSHHVETSAIDSDHSFVSPLTKHKMSVDPEWINANQGAHFKIGAIRAYDFFPKPLIKRLEKKRSTKFTEKLTKSIATLFTEIESRTKQLESASDDVSVADKKAMKEEIEDLKALCDALGKETNSGAGPIFDVLVWNDGQKWVGVLNTIPMTSYVNCTDLDGTVESKADEEDDTEESAVFVAKDGDGNTVYDLSALTVLTNYAVSGKYATVDSESMLNYVLNIYDEGNLVSVVVPGGSHGTHVAGIVAGYYKDDPSMNGVAPGAQLISVKIGDTRLSTMETNQGLMRALYHIQRNNCDLVNMSYGEPTTALKTGCFPKGVESLVWKYGTIFVSSAGNDGPCLSTAGAPQAGTDAIIGIGAMFSPQMVQSEYGLVQKGDDGLIERNHYEAYSWSSRGPTMDGAIGVKLMSPGGAIAPIPKYTLSRNQLMNGTSMSSPNACGNIALLLSALKQQSIKYTPCGIETALINTANNAVLSKIDATARGYGLLQLNEAYAYCQQHGQVVNSAVTHFEVSINGRNHSNARGIYIREPLQTTTTYSVSVSPVFHEDTENAEKVAYQLKCKLQSEEHWISPAPFTLIAANGRHFEVKVDPQKCLQTHYAVGYQPVFRGYILGMDATNLSAGPLFRIPVTICNHITYPLSVQTSRRPSFQSDHPAARNPYAYRRRDRFTVGKIARTFHCVPAGACAARVTIKCLETKDRKKMRFCFATLYGQGTATVTFERWARLATGDELTTSLQRVEPHTIFETTLCQYALSYGHSMVEWTVEFVGPHKMDAIAMSSGDQFASVKLRTSQIACDSILNQINPAVKFDKVRCFYAPKSYSMQMTPLTDIGDVDIGKMDGVYALNLEYHFDQKVGGTKNVVRFPILDDLLYESLYWGSFWMLFDSNKQLISSGEAFEESSKIAKQKGYVLKLQLRSPKKSLLNKAKHTVLRIDTVLSTKQQISSDVYPSKLKLLEGSGKITSASTITVRSAKELFISAPNTKDLGIKELEAGTQLIGYLKLNKEMKSELRPKFRSNGQRGSASLTVPIVCAMANTPKAPESKDKVPEIKEEEQKKEEESVEDKQRDAMIDWMNKKLKGTEQEKAFGLFGLKLLEKYPQHLPLLLLKLEVTQRKKEAAKEVMEIADDIIGTVDMQEMAAFFGVKSKAKDKKSGKNKKFKEQKNAVIDALRAKLNVIQRQLSIDKDAEDADGDKAAKDVITDFVKVPKEDLTDFEQVYEALGEWVDVEKDKKCFELNVWYHLQRGLVAKVLAMINEKIAANTKDEKAAVKDHLEMKKKLYSKFLPKKDFGILVDQIELDIAKQFPAEYRLF